MICTSTGTSTTSSYNRHKLPEFAGIPYAETLTRESFAGAWLICPWRPYPIWYQPNFAFMPYRSEYFHWGVALFVEGNLRLSFTEYEPAGAGLGSRISRRIPRHYDRTFRGW